MISAKFATLFIERCFRIGKGTQMWVPMLESVLWERRTNVSLERAYISGKAYMSLGRQLGLPKKLSIRICFMGKAYKCVLSGGKLFQAGYPKI